MSGIKGRSYSHKETHELPSEGAGKMGVERKRRRGKTAARVKALYVLSYSGARLTGLEGGGEAYMATGARSIPFGGPVALANSITSRSLVVVYK